MSPGGGSFPPRKTTGGVASAPRLPQSPAMRRRTTVALFGFLAAAMLHAEPVPPSEQARQLGVDALAGRLWDVAATRFQQALDTPELAGDARPDLLLLLTEAQLRGGHPERALEVLDDPALAERAERRFWTAQALVGQGRIRQAIDLLGEHLAVPDAPFRREARLTRAALLRAIGDGEAALAALAETLAEDPDSRAARLLQARIHLDRNEPLEALASLPESSGNDDAPARREDLLRARARLASGDFAAAADDFARLVESPEHQALVHYHSAVLGLARARLALGQRTAAADGLLAFVQQNPASPRLDEAFDLLLEALPENPAPNDPILARLRAWLPTAARSARPIGDHGGSRSAMPQPRGEVAPLAAEAMFHLALGLRAEGSPDSQSEARRLLTRLVLDFPAHPLVARALLEAGRWNLEDGRRDQALACFEALARLGSDGATAERAQALALEGSTRFQDGEYEPAARAFREAAELLEGDRREAALHNAASALLASDRTEDFDELAALADRPALRSGLELERALHLATTRDPEALPALRRFLDQHPDHPRLPEARLGAALAALDAVPSDAAFAAEQLAALTPDERAALPPEALVMAEIRLLDQQGEWPTAAERARRFLAEHPDHPQAGPIRFELGRALFQNRDFNDARLVFESLVKDDPESPQAPAALLLSARAAAEGATPQSLDESLALFDRLIETPSLFRDVARLEKAEILIRLSRLGEAADGLQPWFEELGNEDPLLLSVGLLLGEALFAMAGDDPATLERALAVYARLLDSLPDVSPQRFRVLYHKGLILERAGREDEALLAYMDVIQKVGESPRGDWKAIELCGFRALQILEKREQWAAAKAMAERIAALQGPRSAEAAARAKALGLEHMIWDEQAVDADPAESPGDAGP